MITGKKFAEQARSAKYDNLKYSQADCQGFVEKVLYDSGCRKPDGQAYNWKGSNSMWRNALSWKGTEDECIKKFGCVPLGAWTFILKFDGGEKDRGYNDSEGNAVHVGIYVGNDETRDSTRTSKRDGVGYRPLKDWNRVGLCKYIDYSLNNKDNNIDEYTKIINYFRFLLDELERMIKNDL